MTPRLTSAQVLVNLSGVVAALVTFLWAVQRLILHLQAPSRPLHYRAYIAGERTINDTAMRRAADLARERANRDYLTSQAAAFEYLSAHPNDWGTEKIWYLMGPFHNCVGLKRFGTPTDGGKWVCYTALPQETNREASPCTVFSLGCNGDVTFEQAILAEYPHCSMHTFDPTLDTGTAERVGSLPGITFHPQGLTSRAKLRARGRDFIKITKHFTTIQQSMKDLNVRWLDVLKLDIEGEEWAVMLEMLDSGMDMPFTQILIEIHTVYGVPENMKVRQLLQRFFEGMNKVGYRIFAAEENALQHNECWEYGFVKVDKDGYVIRKRVQ